MKERTEWMTLEKPGPGRMVRVHAVRTESGHTACNVFREPPRGWRELLSGEAADPCLRCKARVGFKSGTFRVNGGVPEKKAAG